MTWHEAIIRIGSLVGLIIFTILVFQRLGIQVYKGKAIVGAIAIGIPVITHTIAFNILEKRLKWFAETTPDFEVAQKAEEEPGNRASIQLAEEDCCGGTQDERETFKEQLNKAWNLPGQSAPELLEVLPQPEVITNARIAFEADAPTSGPNEELEIDWNATRLAMLTVAEATGGEVNKAMVAEMMLEADQFMRNMNEADAIAIADRTQEIWNRMAPNLPNTLVAGTNATVLRKTFEIQAAIERSILTEEKAFWEKEHQTVPSELAPPQESEAK